MKKIILRESDSEEKDIFMNFLSNKEFPQHRNMIFSAFPELKDLLESSSKDDEEKVVGEYLSKTRSIYDENIKKTIFCVEQSKDLFGASNKK